jgi:hypothetical protein
MNKSKLFVSSILLIISLFIIQSDLYSQLPCTIWSKLYNGPANQQDSAVAMTINAAGDVFVTGWSLGSGTGADIVVIRYNPTTGDTVWVARFNGTANVEDKPTSIACDNNAVYVTGWSFGAANNRNVVTLKYNSANGAPQFANIYNGPGNGGDYGWAVAVDGGGNVYSAGRTDNGGAQKFLVLKYDASGNTVAPFPFIYTGASSTTFDEAHSIKVDGAGNIYLTGRSGLIANGTDYMTMKVNSSAVDQWVKKHNGTANGEDNALTVLIDNSATNVYVAGYSFRTGQQQDYLTIRYNGSNGDSTAAAVYTGPAGSTDALSAAAIDNAGNVYVTGSSSAVGTALDFATIKYNSSLVQQWLARTTGPTNETPTDLAVDNASGNVYVTGAILSGNYDYLTIAYFGDGSTYWQKTETGTGNANDFAAFIVAGDSTRVFVTGSANFSATGIAMYTLRYTACTGIEPISSNVPSSFALMQNYPNPFNPATTIRFDIAKSSFVKIMVYDITGRELEVLASENLRAGEYEVKWDAAKYSSGVYFYSIITDNFVQTKKMILTK